MDPHVGLLTASWVASLERDLDPVALGLQRDRPAEGRPEEEQQPEAREGEGHRDGDLTDCRCALSHQLHPGMFLAARGWPVSW